LLFSWLPLVPFSYSRLAFAAFVSFQLCVV
jgi:hypothetical protein